MKALSARVALSRPDLPWFRLTLWEMCQEISPDPLSRDYFAQTLDLPEGLPSLMVPGFTPPEPGVDPVACILHAAHELQADPDTTKRHYSAALPPYAHGENVIVRRFDCILEFLPDRGVPLHPVHGIGPGIPEAPDLTNPFLTPAAPPAKPGGAGRY